MYLPIAFQDSITILPMILRPYSRGYITLRSSNPFHKPYITHNYLTDPRDVATLVEGNDCEMFKWKKIKNCPFQGLRSVLLWDGRQLSGSLGPRYFQLKCPVANNIFSNQTLISSVFLELIPIQFTIIQEQPKWAQVLILKQL